MACEARPLNAEKERGRERAISTLALHGLNLWFNHQAMVSTHGTIKGAGGVNTIVWPTTCRKSKTFTIRVHKNCQSVKSIQSDPHIIN